VSQSEELLDFPIRVTAHRSSLLYMYVYIHCDEYF